MKVTDELIENLAHLSRLRFNDEEKKELAHDLERMIDFVEKLNELDTSGIQPLLHMGNEINVLRDDEVKGSVTREEALRNAPVKDDAFFKVPKVIRKNAG